MEHTEFEITISKQGKVSIEISGAPGPRCLKYAELLAEIVGREEERHLTSEYYEPDRQVHIDADVRARRES